MTWAGEILVTIADGANSTTNDNATTPALSSNSHPHGKAIGTKLT